MALMSLSGIESPFSIVRSSLKVKIPLLQSAEYRWLTMFLRVSSPRKLMNTSYVQIGVKEDEDAIAEQLQRGLSFAVNYIFLKIKIITILAWGRYEITYACLDGKVAAFLIAHIQRVYLSLIKESNKTS